jgi:3-methyladenine DNA glycosylase AlkD
MRLVDELLRRKAWWDSVDPLSAPLAARLLQQYPELWKYVDQWSLDKDFWVRRAAILIQRTSREKTDATRLFAYVKANANDPELFIQKAIGWALRSYARTDEQSVRNFLKEIKLSPLAFRQAMSRAGKMFD